jgi:hypothetical protein
LEYWAEANKTNYQNGIDLDTGYNTNLKYISACEEYECYDSSYHEVSCE